MAFGSRMFWCSVRTCWELIDFKVILKLPKADQDTKEWQAAMQALILVAEQDGPAMFARIGVMRALHRHEPKAAPAPRRKRPKVYKVDR
jgi:hypothetical protein